MHRALLLWRPKKSFAAPSRSIGTIRYLEDTAKQGDSAVVQGWVKSARKLKSVTFIEVNDGSTRKNFQCVSTLPGANKLVTPGSAVRIEGVISRKLALEGGIELAASKIDILGPCPPEYPVQKKKHTAEFLREIAHLRPRTYRFAATMRIRDEAATGIRKFLKSQHFIEINTPIITGNDCEGGGDLFRVQPASKFEPTAAEAEGLKALEAKAASLKSKPEDDEDRVTAELELSAAKAAAASSHSDFFGLGGDAFLTVSGQLEGELFASSLSRVYTFGPTFRAERSHTRTHLAEFWMLEPEIAFADLNTVLKLSEALIKDTVKHVVETSGDDLSFLEMQDRQRDDRAGVTQNPLARFSQLIEKPFAVMTYKDAVRVLQNAKTSAFQFAPQWGAGLQREHERYLAEEYCNRTPVFVTHYPKTIKPFYMRESSDGTTVECTDLLVPEIGELIGGSAREERYDHLLARIKEANISPEKLGWYLELRKYGSAPHAGFGMGFERFLLWLTGARNIRDVVPIPRHAGYCKF